jgi:DNA repair exonuclease SbcCD ATPase subunit
MRIIFKRIEIHNFKSFDDEVFEFDKYDGLNLVCGKNNDIPGQKNGAGKSSLFTALLFSLFGETQDSIKKCELSHTSRLKKKTTKSLLDLTSEVAHTASCMRL